jgi:hypothetical protein
MNTTMCATEHLPADSAIVAHFGRVWFALVN